MTRQTSPRRTLAVRAAIALGLLVLTASPAPFAQEALVADTELERIETAHPYDAPEAAGDVVWQHVLHRKDAAFIAVHFERFELAEGDILELTSPDGSVRHTYTGRGFEERGKDFWGLSVLGDTMVLRLIGNNPAGGAFGIVIDRWTHGFPLDDVGHGGPEALCGAEDFQDAECYRSSHPEEFAKGRAVVRLLKNGASHCTGWLASCENHLITNEHCVASQSELDQIEFQFEYKRPECGNGTPTSELQIQGGTLLEVNADLDYALIMPNLGGGDPQATYGFMQLDNRLPDDNELMYIAHHPSGDPKRLSIFSTDPNDESGRCEVYSTTEPPCSGSAPQQDVGYYCDTEGGSSGSPVLALSTHRVIALHHCARCPNRGVPITEVYADIQASAHPLPPCSVCEPGQPASSLVATADGTNRIRLTWSASPDGVSYNVYRSRTSCGDGLEPIGTSTSTSFVDTQASGSRDYYYVVRAVNECGTEAVDSNCATGQTTGGCIDRPAFAGLERVVNTRQSACTVELGWSAGTPLCGSTLRYNVYRSTSAGVTPGPSQLVASCVEGTTWNDTNIDHGQTYHYLVRAEDNSGDGAGPCAMGNEDSNGEEQSGFATGPLRSYVHYDFEAADGWTLEGEWEIGAPQGLGGSAGGGSAGPDPTSAFAGTGVLGTDLSGQGSYSGNYENSLPATYATSPTFDTGTEAEALLRFRRWLGSEKSRYDQATVEVYDGSAWQTVWTNPDESFADTAWQEIELDVSAHLAGQTTAQVRFGIDTDVSVIYCGWNIDELDVLGGARCNAPGAGISPVPDGARDGGTAMQATRAASAGDVTVSWDVTTCPAPSTHLYYGDSDTLTSYGFAGAACSLSASGNATVAIPDPQPGHFTWWTLASADGATESHHGSNSAGALRTANGNGFCGVSEHDVTGTCP